MPMTLDEVLSKPIAWEDAEADPERLEFLEDLQANILKGHGRPHTANIFIGFGELAPEAVAALIRAMGSLCTSAADQLRKNIKDGPKLDGGTVCCFFLSAKGYGALGTLATLPEGVAFGEGMEKRQALLSDVPRKDWDPAGWQDDGPDAMLLIADADAEVVWTKAEAVMSWLKIKDAEVLAIERGNQQFRTFEPDGTPEGVEHFGYVDGRSQPLFLDEAIKTEEELVDAEPAPAKGDRWNFRFSPSQFLLADPNGEHALSAGSFFVFRKLEQNVLGFNQAEDDLADALFATNAGGVTIKPTQQEKDRAGAMIVGRYENGTPLVLAIEEMPGAVPNAFNYDADIEGKVCPFHAHIRKTNPRGDVKRRFGSADGDRTPIMARRGITYGPPRPMLPDRSGFADAGREPETGSGLLFMAYMSSIEDQFEFTQSSWANNTDFLTGGTGVDPVIGQSDDLAAHEHPFVDGHMDKTAPPKRLSFANFVHLKGGEYFFTPSLSFLRTVGMGSAAALVAAAEAELLSEDG